ncbi:hypothetical protein E2562_023844 [Oryza meyeriana var. granulata]|uniref:Uncharacterized protein n=1 Tax=Oryza meyeriana var. granulata TaxID=110450 RepID=A0A6G1D7E2_9ORYZ|nr:hypothetical protein E2562_023844 [Oryza meyeriana var. granulata]
MVTCRHVKEEEGGGSNLEATYLKLSPPLLDPCASAAVAVAGSTRKGRRRHYRIHAQGPSLSMEGRRRRRIHVREPPPPDPRVRAAVAALGSTRPSRRNRHHRRTRGPSPSMDPSASAAAGSTLTSRGRCRIRG